MILKMIAAMIAWCVSGVVFACSVPPLESRELPIEAVYRAESAGIVRFDRFKEGPNKIIFYGQVKKVFWGMSNDLQSVEFKWDAGQNYVETVVVVPHDSSKFWLGKDSNLGYGPDCSLLPRIRIGVDYIFLQASPLSKYSLERFSSTEDPWYELVSRSAMRKSINSKAHGSRP
jgi:hypothetical protein